MEALAEAMPGEGVRWMSRPGGISEAEEDADPIELADADSVGEGGAATTP